MSLNTESLIYGLFIHSFNLNSTITLRPHYIDGETKTQRGETMPSIIQLNTNKSYRVDKTSYPKFEPKTKPKQNKTKKNPQNIKKIETNLNFNGQI